MTPTEHAVKPKRELRAAKGESRKSPKPAAGSQQPAAKSGTLRIQWFRSAIAAPQKHKVIVKGLGFTRLNQIVERPDSASIRGMVNKIPHLVKIVA
jgi:large subunit ribosomal protein L30